MRREIESADKGSAIGTACFLACVASAIMAILKIDLRLPFSWWVAVAPLALPLGVAAYSLASEFWPEISRPR